METEQAFEKLFESAAAIEDFSLKVRALALEENIPDLFIIMGLLNVVVGIIKLSAENSLADGQRMGKLIPDYLTQQIAAELQEVEDAIPRNKG